MSTFSAASLTYLGGLLIPHVKSTDVTILPGAYPTYGTTADSLGMGGRPCAIDVERRELLMGTRFGRIARLSLVDPALHTDGDVNTFPTMPYATPAMVTLGGDWTEIASDGNTGSLSLGGLLPLGADSIIGSITLYYDANGTQRKSHHVATWPSESPAADYVPAPTPFRAILDPHQQGLVAGYMTPIPAAWQDRLKGDTLTGNASMPIITIGSAGPCAVSFRAADLLTMPDVPGLMLVGYPSGHWMPGHPWDNPLADDVYNMGTQITGMAIVGDHLVFVGSHGYGPPCYGYGTSDESLHGTTDPHGEMYCYDPSASAKANHAYPYRVQVWHYPLEDLAAVAAGTKAPWDLVPAWFALEVPFCQATCQVNGCAFDPTTNRFYLNMYASDGYGYEPGPVTYVYQYNPDATVEPPAETSDAERIAQLEKQVAALTVALAAQRQRHAATLATINEHATHIIFFDDGGPMIRTWWTWIVSPWMMGPCLIGRHAPRVFERAADGTLLLVCPKCRDARRVHFAVR